MITADKRSTGWTVLAVSNEVSNTLNLLDLETLAATPGIGSAGYFAERMLKDVCGCPVYEPTGIFAGMRRLHQHL